MRGRLIIRLPEFLATNETRKEHRFFMSEETNVIQMPADLNRSHLKLAEIGAIYSLLAVGALSPELRAARFNTREFKEAETSLIRMGVLRYEKKEQGFSVHIELKPEHFE